jgi:Domain of unknown function (DUF4189)
MVCRSSSSQNFRYGIRQKKTPPPVQRVHSGGCGRGRPVAPALCASNLRPMHECLSRATPVRSRLSHPHEIRSDCLIIQNQCSAQCGGAETSLQPVAHQTISPVANAAGGEYGAIAYDKDSGAWGLSDFSQNQDSANRSALGFCGTYGPHCVIVASFSNICAAVATGGKNVVAWAKGPDRDAAQKDAVSSCAKKAKTTCSLRRSNCYSP